MLFKRPRIGIIVLLVLIVIFALFKISRFSDPQTTLSKNNTRFELTTDNPFGVMIGAPLGMSLNTKMQAAKQLGVTYYRPTTAIFLDKWNGTCKECAAASRNGLRLILTIRNGGGHGNPSTPPKDEKAYLQQVSEILDTHKPEVLVVENEENSMELFYTGTPQEYHRELKIACDLAHSKNSKCTNGGLVSSLVIGLVYDNYIQNGQLQKAEQFLDKALTSEKLTEFKSQQTKVEMQITRGKGLLTGYKSAGADYVNFHWYSDSPEALAEAKVYIEQVTGLPAISNEIGQQKNVDPNQVTSLMNKVVELKIPIAVWYSVDTLTHGQAKSLTDLNGTLRENGIAFQEFIQKNFN